MFFFSSKTEQKGWGEKAKKLGSKNNENLSFLYSLQITVILVEILLKSRYDMKKYKMYIYHDTV